MNNLFILPYEVFTMARFDDRYSNCSAMQTQAPGSATFAPSKTLVTRSHQTGTWISVLSDQTIALMPCTRLPTISQRIRDRLTKLELMRETGRNTLRSTTQRKEITGRMVSMIRGREGKIKRPRQRAVHIKALRTRNKKNKDQATAESR